MASNTNLLKIIAQYKDKYNIIYKANPGNAGDGVIAAATYDFFEKNNLPFSVWKETEVYTPEKHILCFGGGGNMIEGLYRESRDFLEQYENQFAKVIIFPSTIHGYEDFFVNYPEKFIVCCREQISYQKIIALGYVSEVSVLLTHDMAFDLDVENYIEKIKTDKEVVNCFRTDNESKDKQYHENNHDISLTWNGHYWDNISLARNSTRSLISFLQEYKTVNTDRLHIAILGSLLNMQVNFHPNSYYKNEAVFNHSILNMFSNTIFLK